MGFLSKVFNSKPENRKAPQVAGSRGSGLVDFDPKANHDGQRAPSSLSSFPPEYEIVIPHESTQRRRVQAITSPSPSYIFRDLPFSAQRILRIFEQGLKLGGEHGVVNAFNSLRERRFKVWVDNNPGLQPVTKVAIRQTILQILLLAQTMDCDMEFLFMSQSNTQSKNLSEQSRTKAEALETLWSTTNWEEAVALVKRSEVLQKLGLSEWIEKHYDTRNQQQKVGQSTMYNDLWTAGAPQKSDGLVIAEVTDGEKHVKLLNHARDLKARYWQGYHQKDLDMNTLTRVHKTSIALARKQPKSLNSVAFTYMRETALYKRLMADMDQAMPTTVLLLTGSPLQPTESRAIQKFQSENDEVRASKIHRKETKKDTIEGQGTQFCISTLAFDQYMDKATVRCYQAIDDHFGGEDDINDLIQVNDSCVVKSSISERAWLKLLNAHNKGIDAMKFKREEEKYGGEPLVPDNKTTMTMPGLPDVKTLFGEDLDEEGDPEV